jgi:phospholipid/cholesterol/gamma-HCH transport system substrate-binding protein
MFDAKKQLKWLKLKVGVVITVALFILVVAVFFAANIQNILTEKAELKIQFTDVMGLRRGAPVWILGIEEGSVKSIKLDPVHGVVVTVSVNRKSLQFVGKESQATIMTMGLLGDKYIELSAGPPHGESIRPGETIKGSTQTGLRSVMETVGVAIEKMGQFIERVDKLVTRIEKGQGTIAKFLNDPTLYNHMTEASRHLSAVLEDVRNSRGTLKLLLEDPSVYNRILSATVSMEEFTRRINESSGTLKNLIEDPSLYNKILAAASQAEEFSRKLNEGRGTLRKMIEDPTLYENFNRDLDELSSILGRIDKGEGVAGALIQDKELARELKDTITELKELLKDIKDHPGKYFKFSLF